MSSILIGFINVEEIVPVNSISCVAVFPVLSTACNDAAGKLAENNCNNSPNEKFFVARGVGEGVGLIASVPISLSLNNKGVSAEG